MSFVFPPVSALDKEFLLSLNDHELRIHFNLMEVQRRHFRDFPGVLTCPKVRSHPVWHAFLSMPDQVHIESLDDINLFGEILKGNRLSAPFLAGFPGSSSMMSSQVSPSNYSARAAVVQAYDAPPVLTYHGLPPYCFPSPTHPIRFPNNHILPPTYSQARPPPTLDRPLPIDWNNYLQFSNVAQRILQQSTSRSEDPPRPPRLLQPGLPKIRRHPNALLDGSRPLHVISRMTEMPYRLDFGSNPLKIAPWKKRQLQRNYAAITCDEHRRFFWMMAVEGGYDGDFYWYQKSAGAQKKTLTLFLYNQRRAGNPLVPESAQQRNKRKAAEVYTTREDNDAQEEEEEVEEE